MRTTLLIAAIVGTCAVAARSQQPQPDPRQQPGAMVHIYAPEQHDLYDGQFIISAEFRGPFQRLGLVPITAS